MIVIILLFFTYYSSRPCHDVEVTVTYCCVITFYLIVLHYAVCCFFFTFAVSQETSCLRAVARFKFCFIMESLSLFLYYYYAIEPKKNISILKVIYWFFLTFKPFYSKKTCMRTVANKSQPLRSTDECVWAVSESFVPAVPAQLYRLMCIFTFFCQSDFVVSQ